MARAKRKSTESALIGMMVRTVLVDPATTNACEDMLNRCEEDYLPTEKQYEVLDFVMCIARSSSTLVGSSSTLVG